MHEMRTAVAAIVIFTLLTGVAYPLAITGTARLFFPHQANGSLIVDNGKPVGSELIGQPFDDPRYFWGRPSATSPFPYNAASSSGSNLAVSNPAQREAICERIARLRAADPENTSPIPADLVTASASGLDPHISPAAADFQAARVARLRGLPVERIRDLSAAATEPRQLGLLGQPRVNVLLLNRALDDATRQQRDNTR
jgi:potassium-transporting ATPase KdpC subunit